LITMDNIHRTFAQHGWVRAQHGKVLGGVIAGLGRRIGIEPWPARWLFLLALLVIPGSQLLVYPALWILMPSEERAAALHASAAFHQSGPYPGTPVPPAA
jgi:phage shock protein C